MMLLWLSSCCMLITQVYDHIAQLISQICGHRSGLIWSIQLINTDVRPSRRLVTSLSGLKMCEFEQGVTFLQMTNRCFWIGFFFMHAHTRCIHDYDWDLLPHHFLCDPSAFVFWCAFCPLVFLYYLSKIANLYISSYVTLPNVMT